MYQSTIRRSLLVFVLSLVIASTAASAAPAPGWSLAGELGRSAWRWLAAAFEPQTLRRALKAGCEIDPGGREVCAPAGKLGCEIDPGGREVCAPAPAPKHGCLIDPSGAPRCAP